MVNYYTLSKVRYLCCITLSTLPKVCTEKSIRDFSSPLSIISGNPLNFIYDKVS